MSPRSLLALSVLAVLLSAGACGAPIDDEARDAFRTRLGSTSLTVYPAFLRSPAGNGWDDASAARLAKALVDAGHGQAAASDAHVPITGEVHMNQARIWRESAAEFGAWIAAHPPQTDYAILAEYIGVPTETQAFGVHAYVVDRSGKLVDGVLLNDHHEGFAPARPRSAAECTELLVTVMRELWPPRAAR